MIIADNYVLKDAGLIEENLIEFLKRIMPQKLKKQVFQLTIIIEENEIPNIENRHKSIIQKLKEFLNYEVDLTLLATSKNNLHDRNILTNYMVINSGYGFTLFKNSKVKQNTTLRFEPITYLRSKSTGYFEQIEIPKNQNYTLETYNSLKNQFSQINDKTININNTKYAVGNKKNRLLN